MILNNSVLLFSSYRIHLPRELGENCEFLSFITLPQKWNCSCRRHETVHFTPAFPCFALALLDSKNFIFFILINILELWIWAYLFLIFSVIGGRRCGQSAFPIAGVCSDSHLFWGIKGTQSRISSCAFTRARRQHLPLPPPSPPPARPLHPQDDTSHLI